MRIGAPFCFGGGTQIYGAYQPEFPNFGGPFTGYDGVGLLAQDHLFDDAKVTPVLCIIDTVPDDLE